MKTKPYRAKSLSGAQQRVRQLDNLVRKLNELLNQFDRERRLMARLAADTPQFSNPLAAIGGETNQRQVTAMNTKTPTLRNERAFMTKKTDKKFRPAIRYLQNKSIRLRESAKRSRSLGYWWDAEASEERAKCCDVVKELLEAL